MKRYVPIALAVTGMLLALAACSGSGSTADSTFNIGNACERTSDCSQGLVCYRTQDLDGGPTGYNYLPDGYCSKNCSLDDDCCLKDQKGCGNACVQGYCMKGCTSGDQCNRKGYQCWDSKVCVANFDDGIGKSCGGDGDCGYRMSCAEGGTFPGGYCAFHCENALQCPVWGGAICADPSYDVCVGTCVVGNKKCMAACATGDTTCQGACTKNDGDCQGKCTENKFCLNRCALDSECRSGDKYVCQMVHTDADLNGYPQDINACVGTSNLGADCKADGDCSKGLACADTADTLLAEKVCTAGCTADTDCGAGAACAPGLGDTAAATCAADADCGGAAPKCLDLGPNLKACSCEADADCKANQKCGDYGNGKVCMCSTNDACAAGFSCMDTGQGFNACAKGFCARACRRDTNCGKEKYACRYKSTDDTTNEDVLFCADGNNLGAACGGNDDCRTGLSCDTGEAYAGGMCTAGCANDSDCANYDQSWCIGGHCQRSCDDATGRGWDYICARALYTCHKLDDAKGYVCTGYNNYGAACKGDTDCSKGLICREGNAFPGGYCTAPCENDNQCPAHGFGTCQNGYCARACKTNEDCGRYGFACIQSGAGDYCSIQPNVGSECKDYTDDKKADCTEGLYCKTGADWPGGYCTRDCASDSDCPQGSDSVCVSGVCMRSCGSDDDCLHAGYTCHTKTRKVGGVETDSLVCIGVPNTGASCTDDKGCTTDDSYQLTCRNSGSEWAGSSCTMTCGRNDDCPQYSTCGGAGAEKVCVRKCQQDAECGRKHYICLNSGGEKVCSANDNVGGWCDTDADCTTDSGLKCTEIVTGVVKACAKTCTGDSDCFPESNGKCNAGKACVRGCTGDADCGRPHVLCCDQGNGWCAPVPNYGSLCGADTDCWGVGITCIDVGNGVKVCTKTCGGDSDCPATGEALCDTWCMRACRQDGDCASNFTCDTGKGHCKLQ